MNRKDAHSQMIHELERKKMRVTIRLDADMVAWFRKMGPNYGPRINKVLRIYYAGVVSGNVSAYPNDRVVPRLQLAAQREMDKLRADLKR